MKLTSKKVARPTTRTPSDDPDPLGFGTKLAEIIAELKDAYHARLRAFLLKFLLVRLDAGRAPAHPRRGNGAGRPRQLRPQDHRPSPRRVRLLSRGRRTEDAVRRTLG